MLNAFLKFIEHHKLVAKNDKVLVAISGGKDSVVLADLFKKSDFNHAFAHCNFQLRGDESDKDQEFIENLAEKSGVKCYMKKFDTLSIAQKQGISTQMAARNLRYEWFNELLTTFGFDKLATGHQKNDNLETVIFNLTKGTGIAGFHGIKVQNGNIIRPLLFASREEIEDYIHRHNLRWREDSSNSSIKYHRNLIRHKVIPLLKEINPNLENSMEQTIRRLTSVEDIFLDQVRQKKPQLIEVNGEDVWISIEKLKKKVGVDAILAELLKDYGFNYFQIIDLLSSLDDQPGKLFFSKKYMMNIDRKYIIISKKGIANEPQTINENDETAENAYFRLILEKRSIHNYTLIRENQFAFLDYEKLTFPLVLRKWEVGDKFSPLGMKGQKKLSDYMVDEKIPVNLKDKIFVLTSGNQIVWVVGHRIDDRYKITGETKNILKISKVPHHVEAI